MHAHDLSGLMDIALHPRFENNRLVYLTFTKAMLGGHAYLSARPRPSRWDVAGRRAGALRLEWRRQESQRRMQGLTFYTGDRFPAWKNNLFVGGLQMGRIAGTGQLQRVVFNERGEELRRETFFLELRQRIRNVRQGPDGRLSVLTDEDDGAILTLEPTE